jgi:pimeloyl-ACP methyl ester carboxylesterase
VVLAVLVGGVVLAASKLDRDEFADQARPGPVVVVPGYGGAASALTPLVEQLHQEGRTVAVFAPTEGGTGDLRVQARRLADLARRTLDRSGAESVDVVGYSAGGVIARLFVRDEGGASVVRRVLTLGSPHHGTDVAALADRVAGGCPTACRQLVTDSDLLRRLNAGDESPAGPRWITVRSDQDRTVTPADSAELEGALNIDVQRICAGATTSHDELPGDAVVLATLSSALGSGAPRAPQAVTC